MANQDNRSATIRGPNSNPIFLLCSSLLRLDNAEKDVLVSPRGSSDLMVYVLTWLE